MGRPVGMRYETRAASEELCECRGVGQALESGVHVARVAQVRQADQTAGVLDGVQSLGLVFGFGHVG